MEQKPAQAALCFPYDLFTDILNIEAPGIRIHHALAPKEPNKFSGYSRIFTK